MKSLLFVIVLVFISEFLTAQTQELQIQSGHTDQVLNLVFSNDSRYLASNSLDNTVKVWDIYSYHLLKTYSEGTNPYLNVSFSPQDGWLICKGFFGFYQSFSFRNDNMLLPEYDVISGVTALDFTPDEKYIVFSDNFGELVYKNTHSGEHVSTSLGAEIVSLSFAENYSKIYAFTKAGTLFILGLDLQIIDQKSLPVQNMVVSAMNDDAGLLAVSDENKILYLYTMPEGKALSRKVTDLPMISHIEFIHDSGLLMIKSGRNAFRLYEMTSFEDYYSSRFLLAFDKSESSSLFVHHHASDTIEIVNMDDAKVIKKIENHDGKIASAISNDGKFLASASRSGNIRLYDLSNIGNYRNLNGIGSFATYTLFHPDGIHLLAVSDSGFIHEWNMATGQLDNSFQLPYPYINDIRFHPISSELLVAHNNGLSFVNSSNYREEKMALGKGKVVTDFNFSANYLAYNDELKNIHIVDMKSQKEVYTIASRVNINALALSKDGKSVFLVHGDRIKVMNVKDGEMIKNILVSGGELCEIETNINSGIQFFTSVGKKLYAVDGALKKVEIDPAQNFTVTADRDANYNYPVAISPNGSLVVNAEQNWSVIVRSASDYSVKAVLPAHDFYVVDIAFSPDGKYLVSTSEDGSVKIWSADSYELILTLIFDGGNYVAFTSDGYYKKSRSGNDLVCFKNGVNTYGFEQFDLFYNRPDLVISKLGYADPVLVESYHNAYLKRLSKMNYRFDDISSSIDIPEIEIENLNAIGLTTDAKSLDLKLKANMKNGVLDRYFVYVNSVPVTGSHGMPFKSKSSSASFNYTVELSQGDNLIEVSCMSANGLESYKKSVHVFRNTHNAKKPNLYLIAISVSDYQDSTMNLKYAVKDGRDMANLFAQNQGGRYENVYIDTLFDSNATVENVAAAKTKLMSSKVDDEVILYVSGHGLLDDKLDFYFASHNMDFSKPEKYGISYDLLEGLLDSIPARKKIFLMDACHSGEVDKEEIIVGDEDMLAEDKKSGLKTYTYRGGEMTEEEGTGLGLQNSFELMQELFANLNRGSGAVVISAAAGNSYALESKEWNNGVFTYAILNGLINKEADINGDGEIMVSELRAYVINKVEQLTHGRQKPTCRQENLEFDWGVW